VPRLALPPVALLVLALAGCAEAPPPGFVSKAHKFRAQFGGEPKFAEVGEPARAIYSVEAPDGALTVTVTDTPRRDEHIPERVLIQAKDDLIEAAGGTQTADKSITLAGKYPGREFAASFAKPRPGALRARIFLAGNRIYQVMAIGKEDYVNSPAATAFLESFMVLE
jgi:hypothetical protein